MAREPRPRDWLPSATIELQMKYLRALDPATMDQEATVATAQRAMYCFDNASVRETARNIIVQALTAQPKLRSVVMDVIEDSKNYPFIKIDEYSKELLKVLQAFPAEPSAGRPQPARRRTARAPTKT